MRMVEAAEQPSFAREALVGAGVGRGRASLDGGQAVVEAVGAARQPDLADAAAAEQAFDQPGAETLPFEAGLRRGRAVARRAEERVRFGLFIGSDQGFDPGVQPGVFTRQSRQPGAARRSAVRPRRRRPPSLRPMTRAARCSSLLGASSEAARRERRALCASRA